MSIPKMMNPQNDFSAGQLNADAKRSDDPLTRAGARQAINWRILNSKKLKNRPGRRALFLASGRVEEVLMAPGQVFKIAFGAGTLKVFDATDTQVFTQGGFAWALATVQNVVWDIYIKSIYICFPGQIQKVLTWDGVSTWSVADYAETITGGNQKRTAFYRISPKNITMLPAAVTGAGVLCTFSAGMNLQAGHIGTRMRFVGRQILITAVADPTHATITIEENLPGQQDCDCSGAGIDPATIFSLGDEVQGSVSNAKGIVTLINSATKHVTMQAITTQATNINIGGTGVLSYFLPADTLVGVGGSLKVTGVAPPGVPGAVTVWDDEVINAFRGYPTSCFVDQNRLGFCNFPAVPSGIAWSAIGLPNDLYPDANPDNAIFELAPNKSQVFFVIAGQESNEFVFCDNRIYSIPISVTNPLKPGSVAFNMLSGSGIAQVQPRLAQELIVYIDAGGNSVNAIVAIGAYTRPFATQAMSDLHREILTGPIAIAAPPASGVNEENYLYVLNADGTVAVGKYSLKNGQFDGVIGWLPWNGNGAVKWVAARDINVLFTTSYAPNAITPVVIVEMFDETYYLDGAQLVNTQPSGLPIPGGKGPLWWLAGGTVDLTDGVQSKGNYVIDANGNLIKNDPSEDLTSPTLVAGQKWTPTFEPFLAHPPAGQDNHQRMIRRKVVRAAASVQNSTGFTFCNREVPPYNAGDDQNLAPPLREDTYTFRPSGRSYDPRIVLTKTMPGPLTLLEMGYEITV